MISADEMLGKGIVMSLPINIVSVFLTDFVGILLLVMILLERGWNLPTRKEESKIMLTLIIATLIDCCVDPFVFALDGNPGQINYIIALTGNSILYVYNLVVGTGFLALIVKHINKKISGNQYIMVWIICIVELVLLLINLFVPIVFSLDENNVYKRGDMYIVFVAMAFMLLLYGICVYISARLRADSIRYFPVWEFLMPIIAGVGIQTFVYGISLQPVCFAVAICGIVVCLQNESLYLDKLTGVYNRYELDTIRKRFVRKHRSKLAAMMLDLNDFKAINDNYSHLEGDKALITIANILVNIVQNEGSVIRFAGDEFVIIFNSAKEDIISEYRRRILEDIENYNEISNKPYKLSAAIGGSVFNIDDNSNIDFLNHIDELMYDDKKKYYETHERKRTGAEQLQ